ncbi:serine hydrolase [Thalassotalea agarivorans]|uniref:CubicO group peptidase, beta-lactamase class C family n=2 Tax=Thalassotalea agarivorans TaxID=349064 RepID=A0A1I0CDR4_THASX|nr:serine hydrolase [Thalassotalea agarivorans]SET17720.1 CubicO group peptidase, beta-lactamase class C family [Thalassotalea agarivorans]
MNKCLFSIALLWSFVSFAQDHQAQIDAAVEKAMATFNIPGVAIAIVKDDKIVVSKGYGVVEKGSKKAVTSDTIFGVASNTKAMTAALLANLVDQGKIKWSTPVIDILPEFQLYDPYVTREFQIIDLLQHNSGLGLGQGDLMIWPATSHDSRYVLSKLKYLQPKSSFRSAFAYNNLMFVTAGEVIARVSNKPWQEVIKEKIFEPLAMNSTYARYSDIDTANQQVASAHVPLNGELHVVGGNFLEDFEAAGAVGSTVTDMSQWIRLALNRGSLNGYQLFSETQSHKMWTQANPLAVSNTATERDGTQFNSYGLGWFIGDYQGYKLAHHSGGILGMVSKVVLVPEQNLGLVVLTNQQSGAAFNAIYREILEQYLALEDKDWVSYFAKRDKQGRDKEKARLAKVFHEKNQQSKPSLPLSKYAQLYQDQWYGDVEIVESKGSLEMRFKHTDLLVGKLEHFQYDTFIVRWYDRTLEADAFVTFSIDEKGDVESVKMKAVSYYTDFSFDFHNLQLTPK